MRYGRILHHSICSVLPRCRSMALLHFPVRHTVSAINPALIESWCLKCGLFIAASVDVRKLQTAEESHGCNAAKKSLSPRETDGKSRASD